MRDSTTVGTTCPKTHLVSGRVVFTYQPEGWPVGVLTGYVNQSNGFILEHVIAFPGAPKLTLVKMVREGLAEAWAREYQYVAFHVPADHPNHAGLTTLGKRCGFHEYATTWWCRHRP